MMIVVRTLKLRQMRGKGQLVRAVCCIVEYVSKGKALSDEVTDRFKAPRQIRSWIIQARLVHSGANTIVADSTFQRFPPGESTNRRFVDRFKIVRLSRKVKHKR